MPIKRTGRAGIAKKLESPRCVYVDLVDNDFYVVTGTGDPQGPQTIANADAYPNSLGNAPNTDFNIAGMKGGYFGAKTSIDIVPEMQSVGMAWVSSVYIDCQASPGVFLLRHAPTRFTVVAKPFSQGWYPLLIPAGSSHSFDCVAIDPASGTGNQSYDVATFTMIDSSGFGNGGMSFPGEVGVESGAIRLVFTDVLVPPCRWDTRNYSSGFWADFSGTIRTGGTFQTAIPANDFRKGIFIVNTSQTEILYLWPFTGFGLISPNIQNSIPLAPGQMYIEKYPCVSMQTFQVMGNTTGHPYMARDMF